MPLASPLQRPNVKAAGSVQVTKTSCSLVLALGFTLAFPMSGQQPTAPPRRPWILGWREATVALGQLVEADVKQSDGSTVRREVFVPVGTGVIILAGLGAKEKRLPFLVTARHVFSDAPKGWNPESLQVRFSWFEGKRADEYHGVRLVLRSNGKMMWYSHSDSSVDLACIPVTFSREDLGREGVSIQEEEFATEADLFDGAAVVVLGYPGAVGASFWTKAVLRSGVVAWTSPTAAATEPFMVDCNIFPGNSGGPVIRIPTGVDRYGSFGIGGRVSFLGIVSSGPRQFFPTVAGGKEYSLPGPQPATVLSASLMGLAVIEPAARVHDLLEQAVEKIRQGR